MNDEAIEQLIQERMPYGWSLTVRKCPVRHDTIFRVTTPPVHDTNQSYYVEGSISDLQLTMAPEAVLNMALVTVTQCLDEMQCTLREMGYDSDVVASVKLKMQQAVIDHTSVRKVKKKGKRSEHAPKMRKKESEPPPPMSVARPVIGPAPVANPLDLDELMKNALPANEPWHIQPIDISRPPPIDPNRTYSEEASSITEKQLREAMEAMKMRKAPEPKPIAVSQDVFDRITKTFGLDKKKS